jgi:hypothetical protein
MDSWKTKETKMRLVKAKPAQYSYALYSMGAKPASYEIRDDSDVVLYEIRGYFDGSRRCWAAYQNGKRVCWVSKLRNAIKEVQMQA